MTLSTSAVAVCCCKEFTQLVEQPRVLDGDDGLGGEVCDQFDLFVCERPHLLAVNADSADQLAFLEHRHAEKVRAPASSTVATRTGLARHKPARPGIGNLDGLFVSCDAVER